MRLLVFLLVATNLAFLAWTQGNLGSAQSPDAVRLVQQINPETLVVVGNDRPPPISEPPASSATAPPAAARAEAGDAEICLHWIPPGNNEAARLKELLESQFYDLRLSPRPAPPGTWWVYIPPLASRAEAERKALELRRLAVPEFFIVQEDGPNRWAISLGIFSHEDAAKTRLNELQQKGVRTARSGLRQPRGELPPLETRGSKERSDAARAAAEILLPKVRSQVCPPPSV